MSYELAFVPQALKEWKKLDPHTRQLFKTRLIERLEAPNPDPDGNGASLGFVREGVS